MRHSATVFGIVLSLLVTCAVAGEGTVAPADDVAAYREAVNFLASPAMAGRGTGSPELEQAGDWIAERFAELGLQPAFLAGGERGFKQPVQVSLGVRPVKQLLAVTAGDKTDTLRAGDDFNAMGFSGEGAFAGPVIFAGYGIVSPERGYDSYAGINADAMKGAVVVAFRYEPMDKDERSLWAKDTGKGPWTDAASMPNKAKWAAERGAAALVLVDPPAMDDEGLRSTAGTAFEEQAAIPVLHARLTVLKKLLRPAGRDASSALEAYADRANRSQFVPDALEGVTLSGDVDLDRPKATIHNIAGLLPGKGRLADELIVVGAHYDHLGRGEFGSLEDKPQGLVHAGADDNASGVAGLLLMARHFVKAEAVSPPDHRAFLFVAFSGEERGLLGSNYLVNHPDELAVPLESAVAMLNFDMIGRLINDKLWVFGTETAEGWDDWVRDAGRAAGFEIVSSGGGMGASDHASFYVKRVPVLHFFTGVHEDYHRATDTPEKINAEGAVRVVKLAERLAWEIATEDARPVFVELEEVHGATAAIAHGGAFLGVMPDYATLDGEDGCSLSGVTPGSPAAAAGLRSGDVIVAWNGKPVGNVRDLTSHLAVSKPNDKVRLTIRRGGVEVPLEATLGRRGH